MNVSYGRRVGLDNAAAVDDLKKLWNDVRVRDSRSSSVHGLRCVGGGDVV